MQRTNPRVLVVLIVLLLPVKLTTACAAPTAGGAEAPPTTHAADAPPTTDGADSASINGAQSRPSTIEGIYRAAPDHLVALSASSRGAWVLTDFKTGLQRRVSRSGDDVYQVGPARGIAEPAEFSLIVARDADGEISSLRLDALSPEETIWVARPCCAYRALPHSLDSEGLRLAGTLLLPEGAAPHPAVVWVHGSGPVTRDGAGTWPLFMVSQGFAVLAVDKRGVGESEGEYRLPDGGRDNFPHMRRRALDVAAAVRSLAARPDIDGERVGLIGASQAGWVIPMAASTQPVAFTITISGGATRIDVEGRYSELAGESTDGGSGRAIADINRDLRTYRARGHDFRPEFAALTAPGLWLYGDNDRVNPTELAVEVIEEVKRAQRKDFTVIRWPRGNHSLQISETGDMPEGRRLGRLVPGLHAAISAWLAERGLLPTPPEIIE